MKKKRIHNTKQFWSRCVSYYNQLKGEKKIQFRDTSYEFHEVNFPKWIHMVKEARDCEIRYFDMIDRDYHTETFTDFDGLLDYLEAKRVEFEELKERVFNKNKT